jgi:hypothetical protein
LAIYLKFTSLNGVIPAEAGTQAFKRCGLLVRVKYLLFIDFTENFLILKRIYKLWQKLSSEQGLGSSFRWNDAMRGDFKAI